MISFTALASVPMARSSPLRDPPATERGLRTRAALVAAARQVFERHGYLDARLIDITRAAHCSAGTFYTYFAGKEEIFAAVLEVAQEDMLHPGMPHVAGEDEACAERQPGEGAEQRRVILHWIEAGDAAEEEWE